MKRLLSIILLFILALSVISCQTNNSQTVTTNSEQSNETPNQSFSLNELKINGVDISEYKIVYANHKYFQISDKKTLNSDYDFDKLSAEKLQEIIFDITGVTLPCERDTQSEKTEKEILIGATNRTATTDLSLKNQALYGYTLKAHGSQIVICGNIYGNTWQAIDKFIEYIKANAQNNAINIQSDFDISGENHLFTIACCGDSITEGCGATNTTNYSYPAFLQRYLWKSAYVYNFGHGGTTMRADLTYPYKNTSGYRSVIEKAPEIDLTLIMLGTNDPSQDLDWKENDNEIYKKDLSDFIKLLSEKNPQMTQIIMNCPAYYGGEPLKSGTLNIISLQEECYNSLVAEGYKVKHFDMRTYSSDYIGAAGFPDTLHPNNNGYASMAKGIEKMLLSYQEFQILKAD